MATRSPDIEAILREIVGSVERGEAQRMEQRLSSDPDALAIGTDASEWAQGHEAIMRFFRDSGPDGSLKLTIPVHEVAAYADGDIGWGVARIAFEVEGGEVPVRMTTVLRREDGEWRLMQMHASIGVPNEQMAHPMFAAQVSADA
jgi:ketosteroid isomerase-like protein